MESISLFDTEADYFDGHLFSLSEEDDNSYEKVRIVIAENKYPHLLPFAFCLSYMGNNVELSLFLLCCCVSTRTNLQQKPMHSVIVQPIQLQTIRTSLCELFNIHLYHCMLFLFFHRSHIKQA